MEQLEREMAQKGIRWQVGRTPLSEISDNISKEHFGLALREQDLMMLMTEARNEERAVTATIPPRLDWRNNNGNWVTGVKDQKTCGSCVAFATCAALESRVRISERDLALNIDLSEAHLFFCGAGRACATGWNFEAALRFVQTDGVGLEAHFNYTPSDQPCRRIPAVVTVPSWGKVSSMAARKEALQRGPVIAGMRVFEDFVRYYRGGVYEHVSGNFMGLHAVCVVGYSDPDRVWIVKNSWGPGWGDQGYAYMRYGQVGVDAEFPFFDPTVAFGGLPAGA
jgi:C1A family cysteine protease